VSDVGGSAEALPDFDAPPVTEIVGAVQFNGLPRLGLPEMIHVGSRLDGYELRELQPPLPPIQELPPGIPAPPPFPQMFFGEQPQRALYVRADERFTAQLQRDRIAINERRISEDMDPSSLNVWPELDRLARTVHDELVTGEGFGPMSANVVELTYVNVIRDVPVHRVLRIVSAQPGDPPYTDVEQMIVRFSFPIVEADTFRGRLHIEAGPGLLDGSPVLQLRLISRRIIDRGGAPLAAVFDACHRDAVTAFVAVTEPEMHNIWRRSR
jgi:hypothetical protein